MAYCIKSLAYVLVKLFVGSSKCNSQSWFNKKKISLVRKLTSILAGWDDVKKKHYSNVLQTIPPLKTNIRGVSLQLESELCESHLDHLAVE